MSIIRGIPDFIAEKELNDKNYFKKNLPKKRKNLRGVKKVKTVAQKKAELKTMVQRTMSRVGQMLTKEIEVEMTVDDGNERGIVYCPVEGCASSISVSVSVRGSFIGSNFIRHIQKKHSNTEVSIFSHFVPLSSVTRPKK